jgi:NADPH:quinone reductase-like Zn-dependent oxidoreductase
MKAEAYVLYDSSSGKNGLVYEDFEISDPQGDEIVAEPLYGAWEGNMAHSLTRRPIDICRHRGEERVIVGNAGVVRVARCGPEARAFRPGDVALIFSGCELDTYGYPTKILGYDAPGTMGCLATRIRIREKNLIRVPKETRHTLPQWAAFSVRYITGWSNWRLAYGAYRLLVTEAQDRSPHVWGWGGGTALATLDLARRAGCRTVMLSGDDARLATIRAVGVEALDRRMFGDLAFDEAKVAVESDLRRNYMRAESAFLACVREKTGGRGAQIFVDNIGGPLVRATMRALSREGVLATCGWKEGMHVSYLRSVACIGRQQHVNTHYATYAEALDAVAYAEKHGWLPPADLEIYAFSDVPALAAEFAENRAGMFPIYKVNN